MDVFRQALTPASLYDGDHTGGSEIQIAYHKHVDERNGMFRSILSALDGARCTCDSGRPSILWILWLLSSVTVRDTNI